MSLPDSFILSKLGIDEVYIHPDFGSTLREKLYQRATISLDAENPIVLQYATHDIILIFHHSEPNNTVIYKFLKFLDQHKDKQDFIKSNTLLNEEELFSAIKSKKFVLVTHRILLKETYDPV